MLFGEYAERYKTRRGGYTRIHKFGYRKGDHAPHAIIELCDNPRDIKFEMTARAVGRQTVQRWLKTNGQAYGDDPSQSGSLMDKPWIRDITKVNYMQLMKFATEQRKVEFENKAIQWAVRSSFGSTPSDPLTTLPFRTVCFPRLRLPMDCGGQSSQKTPLRRWDPQRST